MDITEVFEANMKHYRRALGIFQESFAEKQGLHLTYCYRRSISFENIQHIADALEFETCELFPEEDNKK